MLRDSSSLLDLASQRISAAGANPDTYFRESFEIVVFGSVAAGLDRPDSDIDVLCVGIRESKLKTENLDLISISQATSEGRRWQQSELAGHICRYGIWLRGGAASRQFAGVSEECVDAKRRRVAAFMRRLPEAWEELHPDFRVKYSLKVRREMQRLILLESHRPIPPTRVLDCVPPDAPERLLVCDRLQGLVGNRQVTFRKSFLQMVGREWDGAYFASKIREDSFQSA